MNFKFFFISYSVIYAKYNYCYEVPKHMPLRYFDGNEWKVMKPRDNLKMEIARYPNIPLELDRAELNKELRESQDSSTTTTITTPETTTRSTTTTQKATNKVTIKNTKPKITTNKIPTKTTTLKISTKKMTIKTTKAKCATKSSFACNLKSFTPTRKIIRIRNKLMAVRHRTTTQKPPTTTKKPPTTTKKPPTTTKKPPPRSTKKPPLKTTERPLPKMTKNIDTKTTMNTPLKLTKKFPMRSAVESSATTTKAAQFSGKQRNEQSELPENWWNLMREFVEAIRSVERNKCRPSAPCDFETITKPNGVYLLADGRRSTGITGFEDLFNILSDGIEIDERPEDEDDDASQNKILVGFKEALENQEPILHFDSIKGLVPREPKINKDNAHDLGLKSYRDTIKARYLEQDDQTSQNREIMATSKELKAENSRLKGYLNSLKDKHAKEEEESSQDKEIKAYLDVLKAKYALKNISKNSEERIKSVPIEALVAAKQLDTSKHVDQVKVKKYTHELNLNLDVKNAGHTTKNQNIDIRKYLDAIKEIYAAKDNLQDVSLDLDEREVVIAANRTDSAEIGNHSNNKDILEDQVLKSVINALVARYIPKKKDSLRNTIIGDVYVKINNATSQEVMLDSDKIKSFVAVNHTDTTEIINQTNIEDIFTMKDDLQNKDITLHLEVLEGEDEKADKDFTEGIQVELQGREMDDKDAADGIVKQKKMNSTEDKIIKNDEDIPLFNFKYALDDREQNDGSSEDGSESVSL